MMIFDDKGCYNPLKDTAERFNKSGTIKRLLRRYPVTTEYKLRCYLFISIIGNVVLIASVIQ